MKQLVLLRDVYKRQVFGNVLRNGTYPISVSSERIFQALAIARYANEIVADAIAHGSTGAGNDQSRFDMTFLVMAPGVEIITLTRDMALSLSLIHISLPSTSTYFGLPGVAPLACMYSVSSFCTIPATL